MLVLFIIVAAVFFVSGWIYFFHRESSRPGETNWQIGPYVYPARRPMPRSLGLPEPDEPLPAEDIEPLAYPGSRPRSSAVLLADRSLWRIRSSWAAEPGSWAVGRGIGRPLDEMLSELGAKPGLAGREPVLTVGSGAAPAWLAARLTDADVRPVVPMMAANVRGIIAGVSAHLSRQGYLPATPVAEPGAMSELWIIWLDHRQLAAMDALSTRDYQRIPLPGRHQVSLGADGQEVVGCWIYVSRHGCLTGHGGQSRRLTGQRQLIADLLADVPSLADLAGSTPREWVQRASYPAAREDIQAALVRAGLVRRQTEFADLGTP